MSIIIYTIFSQFIIKFRYIYNTDMLQRHYVYKKDLHFLMKCLVMGQVKVMQYQN